MIRIFGHSDDCIEIRGDITKELSAYSRPRIITIGGEGEGVEIGVEYAPRKGACWSFTIHQLAGTPDAADRCERLESALRRAKERFNNLGGIDCSCFPGYTCDGCAIDAALESK